MNETKLIITGSGNQEYWDGYAITKILQDTPEEAQEISFLNNLVWLIV